MKKLFTKTLFKAPLYILPLLLNLILILLINKNLGDGFININDSAILFTKIEVNKRFFTLWTENNLGYINSLFIGINFFSHLYSLILLKLNLSIKWMELVIYFIAYTGIFYSSWYAFYLIQKRVFNQNKNVFLPFLAAFFYSYNIFNISLIGVIDQLFLLQVLFPYLLYILITLFYQEINLKYIIVLALILGFTINVPIFSFAVYLCLFLPFIFLKKNLFNIKNILSFMLVFIIIFLLAAPLIYALVHAYINPYSNIPFSATGFIFPPHGIMGVFQFFFNWTIIYLNLYFYLYFRNGVGLFSSYMIWVSILIILVIYWGKTNKRVLLFLIISLLLAMLLCKGVQQPFSELNMLMYDLNPLFTIFRTSGSKFGQPIMLILSALILYVLNINKKIILLIMITITIFIQTWVFFNPINFTGEETTWYNKPIVKISQDYKNLISFLNNDKKSGAVIFYPGLSAGHYDLKNGTKFSFQDVLGKYIERPVIYPDIALQLALAKKNTSKIVKDFNPELIGNLSIRYVIIRQDFDISRLNEKAEVNIALKMLETKDFKKVFTSKLFTVFEVNNEYFKDIITIKTPEREYTPTFIKIAPYHYIIHTNIREILGNQIIFRNNYYPQWIIEGIAKDGLKTKQLLVNNFANGWGIETLNNKSPSNLDQNIELNIYFYPQKILIILSILSLVSLGSILTICLFLIVKGRKRS